MAERYPVLQGAEAFFLQGNHIGVLISHGFMGTPQSVRFLGEYIASKGFTVYVPRLKGHGTHYHDLVHSSNKDWIQNIEEGYHFLKQRCSTIFIIGQSMGGTLALNLVSRFSDIKGMILINAAITSIPSMDGLKDIHEPSYIDEGAPDIKAKDAVEITYIKAPLRSIQELLTLMDSTCRKLERITCPTLAFISKDDHVVPIENTTYIMSNIQSEKKEVFTLYNSFHVASMDNEKDIIAERCCQFIEKYTCHPQKTSISQSLQ